MNSGAKGKSGSTKREEADRHKEEEKRGRRTNKKRKREAKGRKGRRRNKATKQKQKGRTRKHGDAAKGQGWVKGKSGLTKSGQCSGYMKSPNQLVSCLVYGCAWKLKRESACN